jgi:endo-1,4-beta-xylanase
MQLNCQFLTKTIHLGLITLLSFGGMRAQVEAYPRQAVYLGSAVSIGPLFGEPRYVKHIQKEYSIITPENAFKMKHLQPEENKFDFKDADRLLEFAKKNRLWVRGHVLVWHEGLPDWLTQNKKSPAELKQALKKHIQTVLKHFQETAPGQIRFWDLANEIFDDEGLYRKTSIWAAAFQSPFELMSSAIQWAKEIDPQIRLFYNDYGIEQSGPKSEAVYQLLKSLQESKMELYGIGFQMHHDLDQRPKQLDMMKVFKRYSQLGIKIHITEYDVAVPDALPKKKAEKTQGQHYGLTAQLCANHSACESFSTWGFWDPDSWLPKIKPGKGRPLVLDERWQKKPAYYALKKHLTLKRDFPSPNKRSNKSGSD